MHTHTNTRKSLTQCSVSPGHFKRGARGRLVCPGVVCTLVNNPRGGLWLFLIMHTHTLTHINHSLSVVCLLVTSRERLVCQLPTQSVSWWTIPGQGLVHHMQTHTYSGTPRGVQSYALVFLITCTNALDLCQYQWPVTRGQTTLSERVCVLVCMCAWLCWPETDKPSPGTPLRVTRGQTTLSEYVRLVCQSHTQSSPGEQSQVRDLSVCPSHPHTHTLVPQEGCRVRLLRF